jgi:hypothetical protein
MEVFREKLLSHFEVSSVTRQAEENTNNPFSERNTNQGLHELENGVLTAIYFLFSLVKTVIYDSKYLQRRRTLNKQSSEDNENSKKLA